MSLEKIKIQLKDNSIREFPKNTNAKDIVQSISTSLYKSALAVKIDGIEKDLSTEIDRDCSFEVLTIESKEGREIFSHSSAHLLGQAVQRLYPKALLTVGPVIENGPGFFYYDIDFGDDKIVPEDLIKIEKEMEKIVKENLEVRREELSIPSALQKFNSMGEKYKVELISGFKSDTVSLYYQGEWFDLCRGPHLPKTGLIKAFKLTAISGAYWKADSSNRMLQRIYGVSFVSKKELDEYIFTLEEAKKRDHRKIGKEMDLFSFQEEAPGFPFWHPKGTSLWNTLAKYIRSECLTRGYQEIRTPMILNSDLWKRSGHWDNFKENMYFTEIDDQDFAVKPMNCPGCNLIYKYHLHSYRDLPLRFSELGTVHRHELSGVLHGLFRVRAFTQDDAHIYTPLDYLGKEVEDLIDFTFTVYKRFGFTEFKTFIATRPEKSVGKAEDWEFATKALSESLTKKNIPFTIKEGEGAFYGPKIEFNIKDSIGRLWQCGTIQLDFSMPERFELEFTGNDGKKHRPVMIHRAIYGSLERFIGILTEHFEGKFPFWISPNQLRILSVAESHSEYSIELANLFKSKGYHVELDLRNEKIGYKIRDSILKKVNYLIIIGDKERDSKSVSYRKRGEESTNTLSLEDFMEMLLNELEN
jgi:threonyl-tRNA synthetase